MKIVIVHTLRFLFFVLAQSLIFNQLEVGFGIHPMIYPLFIVLLPFEINTLLLLLIALITGLCIDSLSNTYGLHTSSLLVVAYLRPIIFKIFAPRDGYDANKEGSISEMGQRWFIYVFGILLLIHHFWFFMLEMFKWNEILLILKKTILSLPISYLLCVLLQVVFVSKPKER
ncbi:MAG: hypothetical protein HYR91_01340 [Flavobacteriia bacterium]|nr:hypothetical protein [Flavobacteriia bacterium]